MLNKRIEITALNRQGREFPVELTIWATRIGATYRFNAFLHDISDKHRAAKRLMAQNAAATALVESPTLAAGGVAVLKAVCEALGWDVGAIWLPDPDGAVLRCAQLWHRDGVSVPAFEAVSRASSFPPGVGLPGRVWQTGQPAWIPDVSRDRNFPRAQYAEQDGLHGAFGFPIRKGGELLGVIEFFSHAIQAPDDELLKMLETLGNLLGQFVGRQRAEAAIKRLSRMHAVLSSINSLIVRVRNREDLLRAVTRVAAEQGGFLSVSIALRGADGGDAPAWLHEGPLGSALQNERSCVVNDVDAAGAPWRAAALAHGARAVLACPLMGGGKALGGIAYCAAEPGFFDTEEIKLLSEVADNIAYAMEFIAKEEKLDHLAYYDSLTQLANRNLFLERLGQFLQAARQQDGGLATVLLDLEHFKALNDTVGIAGGDVLLREVAARLLATVETPSCVARIGGDVFAVVLPRVKDSAELPGILRQRIWRAFDGAFSLQGQELRLDAKLGIALYPEDGADAESLFHNAEAALAKAKESGERYMLYTQQMTTALKERLSLEGGLRRALEQGEYLLHYQPRVDLRTGAICGAEALLRWNAPGLGLVPPARFVPVLEETGLILEVGRWVLAQASADRLRWQEQIAAVPRIAVNVSPVQLRRPDFVATLRAALPDGAAPGIDLEVTESVLMQNIEQHIGKLREVRDLGLEIAIDDFGTGYSSLAYLAKLPVNSVKIDRSFVASMTESPTTMNVVSTIISLAHSMNLRVVAEGVESQEQLRFLRLLRCDEMQGYLFSRPLPADEFAALLRTARLLPLA